MWNQKIRYAAWWTPDVFWSPTAEESKDWTQKQWDDLAAKYRPEGYHGDMHSEAQHMRWEGRQAITGWSPEQLEDQLEIAEACKESRSSTGPHKGHYCPDGQCWVCTIARLRGK